MTNYSARLCAICLMTIAMFMFSCGGDARNDGAAPRNDNAAPSAQKTAKYEGVIDLVRCEQASGWVWNSANPNEEINVDVYIDGKFVTRVPAKNPRPDLSGIGTGNYGYGMAMPASVRDGKPHTVTAKVADKEVEIKPWEKIQPTFTCKGK